MKRDDLLELLRSQREWVEATVTAVGEPQAAVIGVAVKDNLELCFDTLVTSRKCQNLRRDPRVALVMWSGARTVQLEGRADEPEGEELTQVKAAYFAMFTDGPERETWAGITYFRVRVEWVRVSDFSGAEPVITELSSEELTALVGPARERAAVGA